MPKEAYARLAPSPPRAWGFGGSPVPGLNLGALCLCPLAREEEQRC